MQPSARVELPGAVSLYSRQTLPAGGVISSAKRTHPLSSDFLDLRSECGRQLSEAARDRKEKVFCASDLMSPRQCPQCNSKLLEPGPEHLRFGLIRLPVQLARSPRNRERRRGSEACRKQGGDAAEGFLNDTTQHIQRYPVLIVKTTFCRGFHSSRVPRLDDQAKVAHATPSTTRGSSKHDTGFQTLPTQGSTVISVTPKTDLARRSILTSFLNPKV